MQKDENEMKITKANKRASWFFLIDSFLGLLFLVFAKGNAAIALGIIGFVLAIVGWIYVIRYESKMEIK